MVIFKVYWDGECVVVHDSRKPGTSFTFCHDEIQYIDGFKNAINFVLKTAQTDELTQYQIHIDY